MCMKATFNIVTKPVYVVTECPYCDEEIEINFDDFMITDYPGDMIGEVIGCPSCLKQIEIEDIEWE